MLCHEHFIKVDAKTLSVCHLVAYHFFCTIIISDDNGTSLMRKDLIITEGIDVE